MIRHTLAEGWLLLRRRALVSTILACALAMPICLAGLTIGVSRWLGPVFKNAKGEDSVSILLHPHQEENERAAWLRQIRADHPGWRITEVPNHLLVERLTHWFPYLQDLLEGDSSQLLPPLVELAGASPEELEALRSSEAVVAVGPRTSLHLAAGQVAARAGWILGLVATTLLVSAALLAAVWVHLELYRHADEITIMRLIGATESAIRGPFFVTVAAPGALAALLAILGTTMLADQLTRLILTLGLPPLTIPTSVLVIEAALACLLPLITATITLSRHARLDSPTS